LRLGGIERFLPLVYLFLQIIKLCLKPGLFFGLKGLCLRLRI
jgi:hypothetical protein